MNNYFKIAEKIVGSLNDKGYIESSELKKFIELKREEAKQVIKCIVELCEDDVVKKNLLLIHRQKHFRYDARLEILAIWVAFNPSIKKSFNPEDVV